MDVFNGGWLSHNVTLASWHETGLVLVCCVGLLAAIVVYGWQ